MKMLLLTLSILSLAACNKVATTRTASYQPLLVYTDTDTGCQYVSSASDGGVTPRLNPTGKQICDQK